MAEAGTIRPGCNAPCHCDSGKKYKHCYFGKDEEAGQAVPGEQSSAAPPPA